MEERKKGRKEERKKERKKREAPLRFCRLDTLSKSVPSAAATDFNWVVLRNTGTVVDKRVKVGSEARTLNGWRETRRSCKDTGLEKATYNHYMSPNPTNGTENIPNLRSEEI